MGIPGTISAKQPGRGNQAVEQVRSIAIAQGDSIAIAQFSVPLTLVIIYNCIAQYCLKIED